MAVNEHDAGAEQTWKRTKYRLDNRLVTSKQYEVLVYRNPALLIDPFMSSPRTAFSYACSLQMSDTAG